MMLKTLKLAAEAAAEAARLEGARRLIRQRTDHAELQPETDAPLAARARSPAARRRLAGRLLLIFAIRCEDMSGRTLETEIAAAIVPAGARLHGGGSRRQTIRATLDDLAPIARERVAGALTSWSDRAMATVASMSSARLARERAIAARLASAQPHLFQAGLFDRRTERARAARAAAFSDREQAIVRRLRDCQAASAAVAAPELILVLTP
jgi:hypothetical protein